jgi:phosphonate transport system substrate-binding protein
MNMIRFETIFRAARILLFTFILWPLLQGCREPEQTSANGPRETAKKEFVIGIVPEQNIFKQKERYEPLARYLSQQIGLRIELRVLASYENILDSIRSRDLDAAFLGSFTGAVAIKKIGAEPLARPQFPDGISTYHGMIFTRKDSSIRTPQDMKGKAFAFVDKATTAGWLLPLHYFKEHGIDDPASWLGEVYYTGTHEDAIMDVVNGKADVGAAKNTVFSTLAGADERIDRDLLILATSPPVPENGLLACQHIDETVKMKLRQVLLAMHQNREGRSALDILGVAKFIETTEKDYDPVFIYAEEIGLDIGSDDGNGSFSNRLH